MGRRGDCLVTATKLYSSPCAPSRTRRAPCPG